MSSGTTKLINKDKAMKKIIAFTLCSFVSAAAFAALPPLTPEAQEPRHWLMQKQPMPVE
jgi:hypothetical protein